MTEPTSKAPLIDLMLSNLAGKSREIQLASELCMLCNGNANTFRDDISKREYAISGMCQVGQDQVFNGGE